MIHLPNISDINIHYYNLLSLQIVSLFQVCCTDPVIAVSCLFIWLPLLCIPPSRLYRGFVHLTDGDAGGWVGQVLLSRQKAAGGPRRYGSGTVFWKSSGDARGAGPHEHSRYALLSYCKTGKVGEDGGGMRKDFGKKKGEGKQCKKGVKDKKRGQSMEGITP